MVDWIGNKAESFGRYVIDVGGQLLSITWGLLIAVAIIVGINWFGAWLWSKFHKRFIGKVDNNPAATALASNIFRVFVIVVGIVFALGISGVPTSSLVTWVGVIVAALSLSLQSIIQNLVSGFYLLIEQPFTVGDRITVQGQTGTVQRVALRVTVMRNARQEMVMIPNFIVFTEAVRAKLGVAPECLVLQVGPITTPPAEIESEMLPIVRDVIGNADPRPVFLLDAARKDGASVTLRMWLTDSGKQQNELLVALHEKYPDASIEVTEDAWLRQIVVPRL